MDSSHEDLHCLILIGLIDDDVQLRKFNVRVHEALVFDVDFEAVFDVFIVELLENVLADFFFLKILILSLLLLVLLDPLLNFRYQNITMNRKPGSDLIELLRRKISIFLHISLTNLLLLEISSSDCFYHFLLDVLQDLFCVFAVLEEGLCVHGFYVKVKWL